MNEIKNLPNKEKLEELHCKKGLSFDEIGRLYGCSNGPIKKAHKELNLHCKKTPIRRYSPNYCTKQKITDEIRRLHCLGENLNSWNVRNNYTSVYHASYEFFGNWEKAVTAAGIDYRLALKNPWKYNKEGIKKRLIELHEKNLDLSDSGLRKYDKNFHSAVTKRFSSVGNALSECGIDPHSYYKQKPTGYWTKERVLAQVKILIENNEDLSSQNVRKNHSELWNIAHKKFDGWINILRDAGVNPKTVSRLYANTKEFKKKLDAAEDKIIEAYTKQGYSQQKIGRSHGVSYKPIHTLLRKKGVKVRRPRYGSREKLIGKDGKKVDSIPEESVCNWLTDNNVSHNHHTRLIKFFPNLPKFVPIKQKAKFLCDFMLPKQKRLDRWYFIEYWGLIGEKRYDMNKAIKLKIYEEYKNRQDWGLIEIYPGDNLNEKLGFLIPLCSRTQAKLA